MKFISVLTTAIMVLAMQTFFMPEVQAAKPHAKPLPASVKQKIQNALAGVTDFTDSAAVVAAVMSAIKGNASYAPEIVAFATSFVGQQLINDPADAAKVIPAVVDAAVQAQPRLTADIVGLAIDAVPDKLKTAVIPDIATEVMASAPNKKAKAEILNAALDATQGNTKVTQILDNIAGQNDIKIAASTNQTTRYFVDDQDVGDFSGDQGASTLGSFGGAASGGGTGGSPSNTANSPTPAS